MGGPPPFEGAMSNLEGGFGGSPPFEGATSNLEGGFGGVPPFEGAMCTPGATGEGGAMGGPE